MDGYESTLPMWMRTRARRRAFGAPAWGALLVIAVALGVLAWIEAIAPALLTLVIAVGLAMGWCVWLDRYPTAG